MWEASFRLSDGTEHSVLYSYDDRKGDNEQQYEIECAILGRHPDIVWYSVVYVEDPV